MKDKNIFSRQPRFLPEMPSGEVEIPNPPSAYEKPEISWFMLLLPPFVMLVITVLLALTVRSVFMLISIATTFMTLIGSVTGAVSQIRKFKKKKQEREKKYLQFIKDTRSHLSIMKEQQIKAMNEMNPDPAECIKRIDQIDKRLWERTPSFKDFLSIRLGLGSVPLEVKIKYTRQAIIMESDPLFNEPQRLALEFEKIRDVPVAVNLMQTEICGIAGEEDKIAQLLQLLALQIITHHGYDDVRIVILAKEEGLDKWNFLKYIPHIWNDNFTTRYFLCGKAMAHTVLGELYDLFKAREINSRRINAIPHYVFIVEDSELLENEQISKYIYEPNGKLGISSVFTAMNQAYLPMNCKTVINISGKKGDIANRETGEKNSFIMDSLDIKSMENAVMKLAPVRIKNSRGNFAIPSSITLMEMLKSKTVNEIDILSRWNNNKTFKGMSVPIGVKAGGVLFNLDMHETGHGPHGLVAGTTGSGKSELLQTIIISLAINYHPRDLVFVLIDYKGGGMADVFKGMPHLVGTITNLGGNQTTRALLSIKSELLRRQKIFSEYDVNNIDKYQKLYYSGNNKEHMPAIPHLIMIADEFAELKQDQPDFMKELVSATRVGRSLGVHLILATQKPAGVVDDQIWSNSKFKICLKVQDEADSKDVIKRPDASMIKEPGRAFIQVGNDEIFELFQSAYSGADYDPEDEMLKDENKAKRIYRVYLNGKTEKIYPLEEEKIAKKELPSQLKAMVDYIIHIAEREKIEPLKGPWLPPLSDTIYLDSLLHNKLSKDINKNKGILSVPVGILDDPRGQRQEPLNIDFASEGNLFVYGAPGTGKTVFLKTLCMSMACLYTPDDVNIYIMDFGGRTMKLFEKLPHVGGVMTLEEEKLIKQFIRFLFRVMEERKLQFEKEFSEGFADYKSKGGKMPGIVVIIDNYFALSETYEDVDEQVILLAREGAKYGIFIVATATNASLVRYKLSVNFKMAVCFQLTEKSEYDAIVGRTEGLEPSKFPGRGLVRANPPMEFQASLPEFKDEKIESLIKRISESETIRAVPVPVMPSIINLEDINKDTEKLAIGLGDDDLQPVFLDILATPVIMVAGDIMSGKSTLLVSWIKIINEKMDNVEIYAIDSSALGICQIMDMDNVTNVSEIEDMSSFIEEIEEKLDARRNELIECRKSGGNIEKIMEKWSLIIFVIDRLSEFTNGDMYSLKELMERIVKRDRGLKVTVIAGDNTSEFESNWDGFAKAIRDEQTGVLLGSLKEQNLFGVKIPYGVQEKELEKGDGYFIVKNKFTSLRVGIAKD
ncbi:type VII secretion protein EssC [Acetivibrio saccincola]|uniref:Type VII secretion protein EssC n=1 Tax=Acetivibrio saccincola TaxID=1677857 RepID=A0A2S8RBB3_9FIRM|nr:type VII secretion protein EssC [Acetivibrio saccincola]PQQ67078.1 type VII secretion protein EssC [Acetivibrio saccincola]